jgi:hypothetical protein
MDLSTAQQILVIVLSCALAIFLILSIVIAVMVVGLIKKIKIIADKAEHIVHSAENVGQIFKNVAGPMTILRFVRGISDMVSKHKK